MTKHVHEDVIAFSVNGREYKHRVATVRWKFVKRDILLALQSIFEGAEEGRIIFRLKCGGCGKNKKFFDLRVKYQSRYAGSGAEEKAREMELAREEYLQQLAEDTAEEIRQRLKPRPRQQSPVLQRILQNMRWLE